MAKPKRKHDPKKNSGGRPVKPKYEEELNVDGTPEEVALAIMQGPPKPETEWRYLKKYALE